MKRLTLMSLVVALLVSIMALPVAATGNETPMPRYTYVYSLASDLEINESTGIATCDASSAFRNAASQKLTCELQRYNGSNWVTVKTWSKTSTSGVVISQRYAVYSGYTYRLHTTCYVYNDAGVAIESESYNSNQVVY